MKRRGVVENRGAPVSASAAAPSALSSPCRSLSWACHSDRLTSFSSASRPILLPSPCRALRVGLLRKEHFLVPRRQRSSGASPSAFRAAPTKPLLSLSPPIWPRPPFPRIAVRCIAPHFPTWHMGCSYTASTFACRPRFRI